MTYRISGLSPDRFRHLFGLPDAELAAHGARRIVAGRDSGLPDRIELRDAHEGETVLLLNHEHHAVDNAFRSAHAIFVLEHATAPASVVGALPQALRTRLLSIRAFDRDGAMVDADVAEGPEAVPLIERMLADPAISYLHAHFARRGCYAALIERES